MLSPEAQAAIAEGKARRAERWAGERPYSDRPAAELVADVSMLDLGYQACDAGRPLDHAIGDLERRKPGGPGAAQDAQHVVLLVGDAERLEDAGLALAQQVGRLQEPESRLVGRGGEGLALADLAGQGAADGGHPGTVSVNS
ncbi:MAG TPA: hypothetical protein VGG65_01115 [Thermoanaerobaculia bacterium]